MKSGLACISLSLLLPGSGSILAQAVPVQRGPVVPSAATSDRAYSVPAVMSLRDAFTEAAASTTSDVAREPTN